MANQLLIKAIREVRNLKEDEIFLVKDLFKGYEWNRIELPDRLLLGSLFRNWVITNNSVVGILEKTSSKQQKYIKLKERRGEGLISGTNSDAGFHEEVFDEEFEEAALKSLQEVIRKHRGLEEQQNQKQPNGTN